MKHKNVWYFIMLFVCSNQFIKNRLQENVNSLSEVALKEKQKYNSFLGHKVHNLQFLTPACPGEEINSNHICMFSYCTFFVYAAVFIKQHQLQEYRYKRAGSEIFLCYSLTLSKIVTKL